MKILSWPISDKVTKADYSSVYKDVLNQNSLEMSKLTYVIKTKWNSSFWPRDMTLCPQFWVISLGPNNLFCIFPHIHVYPTPLNNSQEDLIFQRFCFKKGMLHKPFYNYLNCIIKKLSILNLRGGAHHGGNSLELLTSAHTRKLKDLSNFWAPPSCIRSLGEVWNWPFLMARLR